MQSLATLQSLATTWSDLFSWGKFQSLLLDGSTKVWVNLGEVVEYSVLNVWSGIANMDSNIVSQVLLLTWTLTQDIVQSSSLLELICSSLPVEWSGSTSPNLLLLLERVVSEFQWEVRGNVIWSGAQVTVDSHQTVSHVRVVNLGVWAVDRNLLVVNTQSVSVGVWVREQSGLQHWVSRWLHVRNSVRRREGSLLNIGKVVGWVLVQHQLTESSHWVVLVWPDLGQVKHREWGLLSLLWGHGLDVTSPGWVVTLGNVLEQVLLGVVWVRTSQLSSLLVGQVSAARVGQDVHLNVPPFTLLVEPLVSVARVAVHFSVAGRSTTVREQGGDLVGRFLVLDQVVPEHVSILQVSLRVSLLGVDEVRELGWVSDEKHWGVVVDKVQVTLLSVELGGETSWVSGGISRTGFTTDGRESGESLGLLTNSVQEFGGANVGDVVSDFKVTVSTGTLSVDDSLRDSLSVEVGKRVNQVEVLQQQRTMLANSLSGEWFRDCLTVRVSVSWSHIELIVW